MPDQCTKVKMGEYLVKPRCSVMNCVRTIPPCICVFSLGMLKAIVGATLLQLQEQTNSSTEMISTLFLFLPAGLLLGNMLIALFYKFSKFRVEYVLASACLLLAMADLYIPWCTAFAPLAAAFTVHGMAFGLCGGGGTIPYIIQTWQEDAGVYVHLTLFALSLGSTIMPYIVGLYLPPEQLQRGSLATTNKTLVSIATSNFTSGLLSNSNTTNVLTANATFKGDAESNKIYAIPYDTKTVKDTQVDLDLTNSKINQIKGQSQDHYQTYKMINDIGDITSYLYNGSYLDNEPINGATKENYTVRPLVHGEITEDFPATFVPFLLPVIALIVAFLFYVSIPTLEKQRAKSAPKSLKQIEAEKMEPLHTHGSRVVMQLGTSYTFLVLAGLFGLFVCGLEATYGGWIIAFGIKYDYTYSEIAWGATLFWLGGTLARFTAFFLPKQIPAKSYLCVLVLGLNMSNLVYLFAFELHLYVCYVCAFIAGICISPMVGYLISFIQTVTILTEWMASILHITLYVGNMILPFITGYLFANVSPLCFLYMLCISSLCKLILLIAMIAYSRKLSKQIDGKKPMVINKQLARLAAEEMHSSRLSIT